MSLNKIGLNFYFKTNENKQNLSSKICEIFGPIELFDKTWDVLRISRIWKKIEWIGLEGDLNKHAKLGIRKLVLKTKVRRRKIFFREIELTSRAWP